MQLRCDQRQVAEHDRQVRRQGPTAGTARQVLIQLEALDEVEIVEGGTRRQLL